PNAAAPGGSLTVNAGDILLSGDGNTGLTGLTTQSMVNPGFGGPTRPGPDNPGLGAADGGNLTVTAGNLTLRGGGSITTDSFSFGDAGNLVVRTNNLFASRDGATSGSIATQSLIAGRSGDLTLDVSGRADIQ